MESSITPARFDVTVIGLDRNEKESRPRRQRARFVNRDYGSIIGLANFGFLSLLPVLI